MTNIASKTFLSAFTVAAISGIAMMSQAGTASAKSVTSCEGTSRQSVIECCEVLVQRKGMPMWMKQTGRNCSSSVVCTGGGGGGKPTLTHVVAPKPKLCKVERKQHDRDGGNDNPDKGNDRPDKGRDNPSTGNDNPNGDTTKGPF